MKKQVFGRRLKRDKNERKALFKGLMSSLVLHGRIKTTEEKAKAIKGQIEKLTTKARKGKTVANSMQEYLTSESITKLITHIAPVFQNRQGGYTRIIRLGKRFSDKASVVLLEWVEDTSVQSSPLKVKSEKKETADVAVEKPKKARAKKVEPKRNLDESKRGETQPKVSKAITKKEKAK